ncbi:MAG TPA: AbrB/MazE/SpoVT family DNA-binding domain-containing protein [Candidatus Paceibacterota bacterium]
MTTTIQKWGNSLGVRLPKELTDNFNLRAGTKISFDSRADGILMKSSTIKRYKTLKDLLKGMKKNNVHELVDWGKPVGKEVW